MFNSLSCKIFAAVILMSVAVSSNGDEVEDLRVENLALKKQVAELQATVQQLVAIQKDLRDELKARRVSQVEMGKRQADLQAMLRRAEAAVDDVERQKRLAMEERATLQAKLAAKEKAADFELVPRRVKIYSSFDADANRTTLSTEYYLLDLGGPLRSKQAFRVTYTHKGKTLPGKTGSGETGPAQFELNAKHTGGAYSGAKSGTLIVDGKAFECEVVAYDSSRKRGTGKRKVSSIDENLAIAIPAATMKAVASGKQVRLKLGRLDTALTNEQASGFIALYRRMLSGD